MSRRLVAEANLTFSKCIADEINRATWHVMELLESTACSTWEDWLVYTERLQQQYFTANDVRSMEKQCAVLLSTAGASMYQLILSKPAEKSDDEQVKLVKNHHQPPVQQLYSIQYFNTHSRKQGESVTIIIQSRNRRLAGHCNYGHTLNDMLRNCL